MRDVLKMSTRPVLNSHSTLKSISGRLPALTERELRDLAGQGGVFALHFMTHMLTGRFDPPATLEEVLRQIDAIVDIGGIECLALGPDYLPYSDDIKRNTGQANLTFPAGLETCGDLLNLTRALVWRGYTDGDIQKILGGNLLRLFRETLDVAAGSRPYESVPQKSYQVAARRVEQAIRSKNPVAELRGPQRASVERLGSFLAAIGVSSGRGAWFISVLIARHRDRFSAETCAFGGGA
jgi:hypothetical protein